jgi:hypothetical protein
MVGIEPGGVAQRPRRFLVAFVLEIGPAQHAPALDVIRIFLQPLLHPRDRIIDHGEGSGRGVGSGAAAAEALAAGALASSTGAPLSSTTG